MNWLAAQEQSRAIIKESIWSDEDFLAWLEAGDDEDESLRALMEFRWFITEQIKTRREFGPQDEGWERRASRLASRLNQRITQLSRHIRETHGADYLAELRQEIKEDYDG